VTLAMLHGQSPQLSSGKRPIDWIYVDDVVAGLLAIARAPNADGQTFDIGSGTLVTIHEIVQRIATLSGTNVAPQFGVLPDRPMERVKVADIARTYSNLGWRPRVTLDEGLRRTIEWYA
jgi:nucleoside-diphosphate-sugar epimerase